METFDCQGVSYRTKVLSAEHAERFAKCLRAHPAFIEVEVQQSPKAKGEKRFYVRYQPARAELQQAMRTRQQEAREERARTQTFTFVRDESGRYHHCLSHQSGQVYEVTEQSCSCEDFAFRAGPNSMICKHVCSLRYAILAEQRIEVF